MVRCTNNALLHADDDPHTTRDQNNNLKHPGDGRAACGYNFNQKEMNKGHHWPQAGLNLNHKFNGRAHLIKLQMASC